MENIKFVEFGKNGNGMKFLKYKIIARMKQIIFVIIFNTFILNFAQAKKLPDFLQQRIDSVKKETKRSLINFRTWDYDKNGYMTFPIFLGSYLTSGNAFSYEETLLLDSLRANLSVGIIYDDEMRDRIIQLMRNEYREDELDTLVNKYINQNLKFFERQTMEKCKIDTLSIFRNTIDSLYSSLKVQNTLDMFKKINKIYDYEVFKLLQLDTTTIFKQTYEDLVEKERKREREEWMTKSYYDYTSFARLCGYIGDKRFIKPLIELLDNLKKSFKEKDSDSADQYNYQRKTVLEALVRMRVEPYYSDYVKRRTLTMEQIMDEKKWLDFSINDFVYVLGTQEAFLELSKYLLSSKPYQITISDYIDHSEYYDSPVSQDAFYLIRDNIENEDIQKIIGTYREDIDVLFKPLYDWMQKNYGKYKIRRIW